MHAIKTKKNYIALKSIYALLLLAGIVCLQTVSAFADPDTTRTLLTGVTVTFIVDNSMQITATNVGAENNYTQIKVPVYMRINGDNLRPNEYYSGTLWFSGINIASQFGFKTSDGANKAPQYFVPADYSLNMGRIDTAGTYLYFDNWMGREIQIDSRAELIGYYVFSFQTSTELTNLITTNNTYTATPNGMYLYRTPYLYGFVDSVIYAINNASDVDELIEILESIDVYSGYLPDILTTMQSQYTELYALISRIFATEGNILSVNTSTFNAVNSILNILNNQYNTQESKVADDIEEVDGKLDALAHDIEIVKPNPNNVGDIANDAISAIDTSYNNALLTPIINTRIIGLMLVVVSLGILSYLLYGGH